VIQSAREVTRIVALIHKMTGNTAKSGRSPRPSQSDAKAADPCAPAKQSSPQPEPAAGKTDLNPDDLMLPDLEMLLNPRDPAYWDDVPSDFLQKFSNNREMQSLEKEVADFLRETNRKSGAPSSRTPNPAKS
jgi:hypothetical protein